MAAFALASILLLQILVFCTVVQQFCDADENKTLVDHHEPKCYWPMVKGCATLMCKDEENGGEKFRINGCTTEKEDGYGCPKDFDGICPGIKCKICTTGHNCNADKTNLEQPPETETKLDIHIQSEPFSGAPAMMSGIGTGAKMIVAIVTAVLPVVIVRAAIV